MQEIQFREEQDSIGKLKIPKNALYGIHSQRAATNFPNETPFHIEWYTAMGTVKLACYKTYKNFKSAVAEKYGKMPNTLKTIPDDILKNLTHSATEVSEGKMFDSFIVPAMQGGAGTSINMNVNEIIANRCLEQLGHNYGNYEIVDPIEHANIYQSTNDVVPTALKVAVLQLLEKLEDKINKLRFDIEKTEASGRNDLRIGYTQMQQAVPTSFGHLFSAYNDALSRDWWRVSKCFERIKVVNLGGSAIGTGISVPRYFIMEVTNELQKLTKLPVTRAENLSDATSNLDSLVEVHAILKAHAVNLEKMVSDLRLLASNMNAEPELSLPAKQAGSSIMPGKINPVIPEYVISIAHKIYANDSIISSLCAQGCLELNAYLPSIGHALIESLKLLISANETIKNNLFKGLQINPKKASLKLYKSYAIATALVPFIGYGKAGQIAKKMKENETDIFEANKKLKIISQEKLSEILEPQNLLKKGFTMEEIFDKKFK